MRPRPLTREREAAGKDRARVGTDSFEQWIDKEVRMPYGDWINELRPASSWSCTSPRFAIEEMEGTVIVK